MRMYFEARSNPSDTAIPGMSLKSCVISRKGSCIVLNIPSSWAEVSADQAWELSLELQRIVRAIRRDDEQQ